MDDLVIGVFRADQGNGSFTGESYVIFGYIGAPNLVGESQFLGVSTDDPAPAPTEILYPPFPTGTTITFQAVTRDAGSASLKLASVPID